MKISNSSKILNRTFPGILFFFCFLWAVESDAQHRNSISADTSQTHMHLTPSMLLEPPFFSFTHPTQYPFIHSIDMPMSYTGEYISAFDSKMTRGLLGLGKTVMRTTMPNSIPENSSRFVNIWNVSSPQTVSEYMLDWKRLENQIHY